MSDRLLSALDRILTLLRPRLAFFATWEYRVVTATGTGPVTVDARAVSPLCPMPDLAGITLWPGPSGAYAVPAVGSRVRVAYVDGDPTKPCIVGLDPQAAPTLVYLSGTGPAVARVGDTVTITSAEILAAGMVAGPNAVTITAPLQCQITSGSAKVFAP